MNVRERLGGTHGKIIQLHLNPSLPSCVDMFKKKKKTLYELRELYLPLNCQGFHNYNIELSKFCNVGIPSCSF
jgi:hypothetical protein